MVGILQPLPSAPPDHRTARWDPTGGYLESTVLATVHMWALKYNKDEMVGHILRNFLGTDVFQAMCELRVSIGEEKPSGHRNTADRSAAELYASEVCDMIVELSNAKKLPKIVVSSHCLSLVPVSLLKTSDEISLGARLESVETGMKKMTDAFGKMSAENRQRTSAAAAAPIVTVTPPAGSPQCGAPASFVQFQPQPQVPSAPPASEQDMRSWAAAVAPNGHTIPQRGGEGAA